MAHRLKIGQQPKERVWESPIDHAKGYEVRWPNVAPLFEAVRGVRNLSFVYVIREEGDGPIKIGVAKDPIKRLRSMQTGNPRRLRIEYVLIGLMDIEKLLHELWEPYAIIAPHRRNKVDAPPGTEWFQPDVCEALFPILETAVDMQLEHLSELTDGKIKTEDLETALRIAHAKHDFVFKPREERRVLAPVMGYAQAGRRARV